MNILFLQGKLAWKCRTNSNCPILYGVASHDQEWNYTSQALRCIIKTSHLSNLSIQII